MFLLFVNLFIFISGISSSVIPEGTTSCAARCDTVGYDRSLPCQCNKACQKYGDCCPDYQDSCVTCENRCLNPYNPRLPCQCNSKCSEYNNCCKDFNDKCLRKSLGNYKVSDEDIKQISAKIWSIDTNKVGDLIDVDIQGQTTSGSTSDEASGPLFSFNPDIWLGPTISKFSKLYDNFIPSQSQKEDLTPEEVQEQEDFLDAMMETAVMKETHLFMFENNLVGETVEEFKGLLKNTWFKGYDHYKTEAPGSSGFEHTFIGELSGSTVKGFHNFLYYGKEEAEGDIDYKGWIEKLDIGDGTGVLTIRFDWGSAHKPIGGFFFGSSPEAEMALGTICFKTRPDSQCTVMLNGHTVKIQTWSWKGSDAIATSYPVV